MSFIRLKFKRDNDSRRISIDVDAVTLPILKKELTRLYKINENDFDLFYSSNGKKKKKENLIPLFYSNLFYFLDESVPLVTPEDWNTAITYAKANNDYLCISVVDKELSESLLMEEKDFVLIDEQPVFQEIESQEPIQVKKEEEKKSQQQQPEKNDISTFFEDTLPGLLKEGSTNFQTLFQKLAIAVDSTVDNARPALNEFLENAGPQLEQFACTVKDTVEDIFDNAATNVNEFLHSEEKKDEKESYSSIKDAFEGVPIKYEVKFVSDESYPDGANIEAGSVFTKTWKLLNSGNVAWPKETCLHFVGGTNLMPNFTKGVHVGEIQPNEEVCVSVTMKAPTKPGKYSSYFRMCYPINDYLPFGDRIWCNIFVPPEDGFQYPQELEKVLEMGFPEDIARVILESNNGNFEETVNELLNQN